MRTVVLRTSYGPWSAGTRIRVLDTVENEEGLLEILPLITGATSFLVHPDDLIVRRSRKVKPRTEEPS